MSGKKRIDRTQWWIRERIWNLLLKEEMMRALDHQITAGRRIGISVVGLPEDGIGLFEKYLKRNYEYNFLTIEESDLDKFYENDAEISSLKERIGKERTILILKGSEKICFNIRTVSGLKKVLERLQNPMILFLSPHYFKVFKLKTMFIPVILPELAQREAQNLLSLLGVHLPDNFVNALLKENHQRLVPFVTASLLISDFCEGCNSNRCNECAHYISEISLFSYLLSSDLLPSSLWIFISDEWRDAISKFLSGLYGKAKKTSLLTYLNKDLVEKTLEEMETPPLYLRLIIRLLFKLGILVDIDRCQALNFEIREEIPIFDGYLANRLLLLCAYRLPEFRFLTSTLEHFVKASLDRVSLFEQFPSRDAALLRKCWTVAFNFLVFEEIVDKHGNLVVNEDELNMFLHPKSHLDALARYLITRIRDALEARQLIPPSVISVNLTDVRFKKLLDMQILRPDGTLGQVSRLLDAALQRQDFFNFLMSSEILNLPKQIADFNDIMERLVEDFTKNFTHLEYIDALSGLFPIYVEPVKLEALFSDTLESNLYSSLLALLTRELQDIVKHIKRITTLPKLANLIWIYTLTTQVSPEIKVFSDRVLSLSCKFDNLFNAHEKLTKAESILELVNAIEVFYDKEFERFEDVCLLREELRDKELLLRRLLNTASERVFELFPDKLGMFSITDLAALFLSLFLENEELREAIEDMGIKEKSLTQVSNFFDFLKIGREDVRNVVLILLDAYGWIDWLTTKTVYGEVRDPAILCSETYMASVFPTLTAPAMMSLVTGRYPGEHGVTGNTWACRAKVSGSRYVRLIRALSDAETTKTSMKDQEFSMLELLRNFTSLLNFPNVFNILRRKGVNVAFLFHDPKGEFNPSNVLSYISSGRIFEEFKDARIEPVVYIDGVFERIKDLIGDADRNLVYVHIGVLDYMLHRIKQMMEELKLHGEEVTEKQVDDNIKFVAETIIHRRIVDLTKKLPRGTLVIVTADHGSVKMKADLEHGFFDSIDQRFLNYFRMGRNYRVYSFYIGDETRREKYLENLNLALLVRQYGRYQRLLRQIFAGHEKGVDGIYRLRKWTIFDGRALARFRVFNKETGPDFMLMGERVGHEKLLLLRDSFTEAYVDERYAHERYMHEHGGLTVDEIVVPLLVFRRI